ncbi:hypothetical protein [Ralstonia pickettii]|uniref:Uncharacterized protein n=1 Tax=Ralstonia pickettii TaxID=329 RepID=A0AAW4Q9T3_RALPI|nr:hypothetical protein [Ralstonia pickettii]MBA9846814.1 hypothetical protein [Ralstonia pickettii]MBA9852034.1 hypothetical protein [Ralstonia pickettii]MBA9919951.1 hypothetical protein [Ralstonia pickettii]MBA9959053.1 hypothetical protein [Ralstonia pickettii]MBA9964569.1 hypothetical protein [Ralstonia pickettii]
MQNFCKTLLVAATFAMAAFAVHAQSVGGRGADLGWYVSQPMQFVVSGVLLKDGSTTEIRPTHGIYVARSQTEAIDFFSAKMRDENPGYHLVTALASPVPVTGTCRLDI